MCDHLNAFMMTLYENLTSLDYQQVQPSARFVKSRQINLKRVNFAFGRNRSVNAEVDIQIEKWNEAGK